MLDWDDLRFFLAVARHRSLSAAAKQLQVTQSTVGRRLASLQDGLGVRLLHRVAEGYALTPAGESIRTHVERVEAETLSLERAVAGQDIRLEGVVRVVSSQLLASHLLAPSFAALHAEHRGILIEALPEQRGEPLATHDADIAVGLRQFGNQGLVARRIGTVAFGLYSCVAYLAHHGVPDLRLGSPGHRLITLLDDYELSAQAAWLAQHTGNAQIVLRADSYETQYWSACSNGGLALLPRFRADADPALRLIDAGTPIPPAEIWLGVHRESRLVPRVRAVLDTIAEAVRARADLLNPAGAAHTQA